MIIIIGIDNETIKLRLNNFKLYNPITNDCNRIKIIKSKIFNFFIVFLHFFHIIEIKSGNMKTIICSPQDNLELLLKPYKDKVLKLILTPGIYNTKLELILII